MDNQLIFTPTEFVDVFNQTLEYAYPRVILKGEISNYKVSKNRWVYFDIKDDSASIKVFGTVYVLPGPLEDGMLVQIICTPRLHPLYNFSLQLQAILPLGEGSIARASEILYKKLEAEGLFSEARKRSLPFAPERIALITSEESAAYADFVKISASRWPMMSIDLYSTLVQGADAPSQIVQAISSANLCGVDYDVVVITRGGGSSDDLAAFNDERIVRAIAGSRIPTMVAIGHEIDKSLAELASDVSASTPSNAAELLTPDLVHEKEKLLNSTGQIAVILSNYLLSAKEYLARSRSELEDLYQRVLDVEQRKLQNISDKLTLLNPQSVLNRGYTLVYSDRGKLLKSAKSISSGDVVDILMHDGRLKGKIL